MRVIHISSLWPPVVLGGAEIYAARLALEQEKAGHTVGVITQGVPGDEVVEVVPPWPYRLETFADQPSVRRAIFHALDLYNPIAGRHMRRAIRRFAPDVIHSHFVAGLSTAALTAGATTAARVHHLHGYWLMCRRTTMVRPNGDPCHDVSCRAVMASRSAILRRHPPDLLLGPSQTVIDAHARLSWAAGRMRHVPHPVDEVPVHRTPAISPPGGPTTFGYLGQLSELKGIPTLLEAFAALAGEGHRLLVGGRGPLLSDVERAGPGVEALGWLDDVGKEGFFDRIHCLIVPSNYPETGPLVALEARARGVPVIGARIGGIPENVGDRCRPLLFTPGDVAELRQAIRRFVADPEPFAGPDDSAGSGPGVTWRVHSAAVVEYYAEAIRLHAGEKLAEQR